MKKLNRRDYLISMGAGAAGLTGAGLKTFANHRPRWLTSHPTEGEGGPDAQTTRTAQAAAPRLWQRRRSNFPSASSNQIVKLIFYGLVGFSWREDPQTHKISCDVGFFNKPDTYHGHKLMIHAYTVHACSPINLPVTIQKLALTVPNRAILDEAYFYQPGVVSTREDLRDQNDFRWIMDFESDYFYGTHLDRIPHVYSPTLSIPCGLFYTMHKTASKFRTQPATSGPVRDLGSVADIFGANIYVPPGGIVKLLVNDVPYDVQAPGEVYFLNHCETGTACNPEPNNIQDKHKRSDFYMNYEAFNRNGKPEFELFLLYSNPPTGSIATTCESKSRILLGDNRALNRTLVASDEAPCSGTGYGGGGGLPPSP
jgi:hypothetical protein